MKKILLATLLVWVVLMQVAWAQDRQVSGKVTTNEDGSPIPGVSVAVKGTTRGVTTNAQGNYQISAASGSTLVFSAIGFARQEVMLGNQTSLNIVLGSNTDELQEVVVTALGVQRQREQLGYNAEAVRADKITQARATNLATALSGKVAGLQINTIGNGVNPQTRIQLRGNRSLTGNNQALIVIDGVQVPSDAINYLNPNDIDNVTVLKGANAAALYGSDASNGALVITTKRGSAGAPKVTLSNTSFVEEISFMPKMNTRFGPGTENYSRIYIPIENQQYGPAYTDGPVTYLDDHGNYVTENGTSLPVGRPLEDGTIVRLPYRPVPNTHRNAFDKGFTNQADVSLSAGDERGSFYISLQDVNTRGIVPGDKFRRTGARMNASREYGKFKGSFGVDYRVGSFDAAGGVDELGQATGSNFYRNILNIAANHDISSYRNWQPLKLADGTMNPANPNNYFNDYFANPYFDLANNRSTGATRYFQGQATLEYQPLKWLSLLYRLGATNNQYDAKSHTGVYNFTAFAKSNGKYNARDIAGSVADFSSVTSRLNQDAFLQASHDFGVISTKLLLGTNVQERRRNYQIMSANSLVVPDLYNISNRVGEPSVYQYSSLQRLYAVYGDLELGYNDWLFVHLSGRNDWTSVLSRGNNSYFYPGADLSLVLTKAIPALRENRLVNSARLRLAATRVGNVTVGPYSLATIFGVGSGFPFGSLAGYSLGNTINDPGLQPEFITSYEAGLELGLLNDRITLDLTYYNQESRNQTVQIDISQATGSNRATVNAGVMANNGFEADLKFSPIRTTTGFRWDVGVNYSLTDTRVKQIYQGLNDLNLSAYYGAVNSSLYQVFAIKDQQYPALKVVDYQRVKDVVANSSDDRVIVSPTTGYPQKAGALRHVGQTVPRHKLGLNTTLSYKGFRVMATAEYRGGAYIGHGLAETMWFTGASYATTVYGRERFVFPNSVIANADGSFTPNTSVTVRDGGLGAWDSNLRNYGTNFVTSADFWKLREVGISYEVPASWISRTRLFKTASIGLVGRNLITLLPKENIYTDPEFNNTASNAIGVNATYITPPTRTYGVTVNLGL